MLQLLWDASGLTKRYAAEIGTPTANALFNLSPRPTPVITYLGYVETYATLWRKRNRGILAPADFAVSASAASASALQTEILAGPDVRLLPLDPAAILAATAYVQQYNLNASDAAILATYLDYARAQPPGDALLFIAADQRFLSAAAAEGLSVLDPQLVSPADLPPFLAAL